MAGPATPWALALTILASAGIGEPPKPLAPPAPQLGARFGEAVAGSPEGLFVGAPGADGAAPKGGAVFVFDPQTCALEALVVPGAGSSGDRFGAALAAGEGRLAVSAPGVAVHLFERGPSGTWFELQRIAPSGAGPDAFGADVALDPRAEAGRGGRLLVGAPGTAGGAGAVHVFASPGPGRPWVKLERLAAPLPAPGLAFGTRVALSGPLAVASAPGFVAPDAPGGSSPTGAAFLIALAGRRASVLQPLAPGFGGPAEEFASAVDLCDHTVAIGTPNKAVEGLLGAGAVVLCEPTPGRVGPFVPRAVLSASDVRADAGFGGAVAFASDRLLVGAPDTPEGGAVYLFARAPDSLGGWRELTRVENPTGLGDFFGQALAARGEHALVGAPAADAGLLGGAGAAWILGAPGGEPADAPDRTR